MSSGSAVRPRPSAHWPLLLIGIITGALSGLLGIGGGIVMVPALVAMGETRHRANANSLATIFLVALAGTIGFAGSGAVDISVGVALGVGGLAGATFGAKWAHRMSGETLARMFGVLLLAVGLRMLLGDTAASGTAGVAPPWSLVIAVSVGVATGILSGIAGVGGGIVMIPAMVLLLGMTQHVAEGTSLLAMLFTAAAGTRVNRNNGYIDRRIVLTLAATGVLVAPLAALFAQEIPADVLSRLFAIWLLVVGIRTLWPPRPSSTTPL